MVKTACPLLWLKLRTTLPMLAEVCYCISPVERHSSCLTWMLLSRSLPRVCLAGTGAEQIKLQHAAAGTAEQAGLFQAQRKVTSRAQQFQTKYTRIKLDHEMVRSVLMRTVSLLPTALELYTSRQLLLSYQGLPWKLSYMHKLL